MFPFATVALAGPGYAPMTVSLSDTSASGGGGAGTETTGTVTATPSGGSGSVTYVWSLVSGDSFTTANSPSSATTSWTRTGLAFDETESSAWHCTVTDAVTGAVVVTGSVAVSLHRNSEPAPIIVTMDPSTQTISVPGGGSTHVGVNASYSSTVTSRIWHSTGDDFVVAGGGNGDDFMIVQVSVANGATKTGGISVSVGDSGGASGSGSASFTVNGF